MYVFLHYSDIHDSDNLPKKNQEYYIIIIGNSKRRAHNRPGGGLLILLPALSYLLLRGDGCWSLIQRATEKKNLLLRF